LHQLNTTRTSAFHANLGLHLTPVLARRNSELLPEGVREVTLVAEASLKGNLGERRPGPNQKAYSPLHSASDHILTGGAAKKLTKAPSKMNRMNADAVRRFGNPETIGALFIEHLLSSSQPGRRFSWRARSRRRNARQQFQTTGFR
jgi:hypothetical protein